MDEKFFTELTDRLSPSEVIALSESESIAFYENADAADAEALVAAAKKKGYSVLRDESLSKFRALTLSSMDGTALHVTCDAAERMLRALFLPLAPALADVSGGKAVCDPLLIQADMGLGIPKLDEGMCYILRARDGSFVVIDSGYRKGACAMHIYDTLKKYSPDGKIKIRAWFFTHAHGDHAGGFFEFAEMYHADPDVEIDRFYFGFIENDAYSVNFDNSLAPKVHECVGQYYPGVKVERPLTGVTYNFAGLGVMVLFSLEDFLPRKIQNEPDATPEAPLKGDGNNLSTVLRVTENGSGASFLALSDATRVGCDAMCARYGALLESDFVQAAHHGLAPRADGPAYQPRRNNGTKEIYALVKPKTALFPCSIEAARRRFEYDVNRYLVSISKESYIADADVVLAFGGANAEVCANEDDAVTLRFDPLERGGAFKILNATNGGPWHKRHANDQYKSNLAAYKAARIPYARNHDSCLCGAYGGPYSHDVTSIFPNFDADPRDPASYDFACTDEAILTCLDAGTETFFRLGQSIEHQIKKHGTLPPKDFKKWAVICEHIIRHYNEGWADGLSLGIKYWEIWNEPDLTPDDSKHKTTWGGTKAQFFDFYEVAAKHLKKCFPDLSIGGPALASNEKWADDFLREMQSRGVPIDFFSWHIYCMEPKTMTDKADRIKAMLEKYGYGQAGSILNEWNYIKGWTKEYVYSLESIHGLKGASFVLACMCRAQECRGIDMLMYYDTRPSVFNGAFDFYTARPLKGYYPLFWYGGFYDLEYEIPVKEGADDVYAICGADKNGKITAALTYYRDDDGAAKKTVALDFGRRGNYEIYLLDRDHNGELVKTTGDPIVDLEIYGSVLIKEI